MRDVSKLKDHIENPPMSVVEGEGAAEEVDDDEFEVLRESPELGDGKFKLEIGTLVHSGSENCLTLQLFSKDTCP